MKQTYKWLTVSLVLIGGHAHAALSSEFVDQSAAIIADSCGSTLNYDLRRPFDEKEAEIHGGNPVKEEYHDTARCIIRNAMAGTQEESNTNAEKATQKYSGSDNFDLKDKQKVEPCEKKSPQPNIESSCPEGSDFSSCRISEAMNAEWCGYNMYLWAKARQDDRLLLMKEEDRGNLQNQDFINLTQQRKNEILAEKDKTEVATKQAQIFYKSFSSPYEETSSGAAGDQHMEEFNQKLLLFRIAVSTWKSKFVNAMAKFCKQ